MRTPGQEEDGKKMGRKIIIILKKQELSWRNPG